MRIIAGQAKGRRLLAPPGLHTRPTATRVREALFSVILPLVAGAKVLDAFAGSGALGLEALSRGALTAHLVENNAAALRVLRRNVQNCCLAGAQVFPGDLKRFLRQNNQRYDIIFMDPPYHKAILPQALAAVLSGKALAKDGLIVVETAAKEALDPPTGLVTVKQSVYGDTALYYLQTSDQLTEESKGDY